MDERTIPFTPPEATPEFLRGLFPDARQIEVLDHGYDNVVGLVDKQFVVRFPRTERANIRLDFEQAILESLPSLRSVAIPRSIKRLQSPPCLIVSYLPGTHMQSNDVRAWPEAKQAELGQRVATFAYELHTLLPASAVTQLRDTHGLNTGPDASWDQYLHRTLGAITLQTNTQNELAQRYYALWQERCQSQQLVAIHDDLHTENLLFEDDRLSGILDFGDANVGSPEQELRQLYRISNTVLDAAVSTYTALSGQELDTEAIRIWAIIQELAAYARRFAKGETDHPGYLRTREHLTRWLPDGEW